MIAKSKSPKPATKKTKPVESEWISPTEAAKLIGIGRQTLTNWRYQQKADQPRFYTKPTRYRRSDVIAWIENHAVTFQS